MTLDHGAFLEVQLDGTLGSGGVEPPAAVPSRVVVLNVFNSQQFPVTLEAVHSLCSYVGPVNRIILFEKDGHTNALVEFKVSRFIGSRCLSHVWPQDLDSAVKAQK